MSATDQAGDEFSAIKNIHAELHPLSPDARARVVKYLVDLFEVEISGGVSGKSNPEKPIAAKEAPDAADQAGFDTFAELFDAADPQTNSDKALVAGYWLQKFEKVEGFDSQSANKLLKNLGHGLANITSALTALKDQKPTLALQLKKSGSSQQARKLYKVTVAGFKAIEDMMQKGD